MPASYLADPSCFGKEGASWRVENGQLLPRVAAAHLQHLLMLRVLARFSGDEPRARATLLAALRENDSSSVRRKFAGQRAMNLEDVAGVVLALAPELLDGPGLTGAGLLPSEHCAALPAGWVPGSGTLPPVEPAGAPLPEVLATGAGQPSHWLAGGVSQALLDCLARLRIRPSQLRPDPWPGLGELGPDLLVQSGQGRAALSSVVLGPALGTVEGEEGSLRRLSAACEGVLEAPVEHGWVVVLADRDALDRIGEHVPGLQHTEAGRTHVLPMTVRRRALPTGPGTLRHLDLTLTTRAVGDAGGQRVLLLLQIGKDGA